MLNDDLENKIHTNVQHKCNVNNAVLLYYLSHIFKLKNLPKISFKYIERCFQTIAETNNFQELHYMFVNKILSSDELNIDSELVVLSAVESWISYNIKERSKHSKDLLLKIRLHLLSDHALNKTLNNFFYLNNESFGYIIRTLENSLQQKSNKLICKPRHCNHYNFNIVGIGILRTNEKHFKGLCGIDAKSLKAKNIISSQPYYRKTAEHLFCIRNEIYTINRYLYKSKVNLSVDKYSETTKRWEKLADVDKNRHFYCACSFMNNIYVIGGKLKNVSNSCIKFNTKDNSWTDIANMKECRKFSACTVYEGRIVVSGGYDNGELNTVEAYDHVADIWTNMPEMINRRFNHKSVAFKNKLFFLMGSSPNSEMYDSVCNKVSLLKSPHLPAPSEAFLVQNRILIFITGSDTVLVYYIEKEKWFIQNCKLTLFADKFCYAKFPHLKMNYEDKKL